eukprot:comp22088_c0_seq1/m.51247 comp22088_c0_seq1/g.51247  ORF comp22088_c0_seq1/g.51247 comp22088_c0_seq1/m.51247 type:complete len:342 (-) comp22088_c0_seq1:1177-2202(-)
MRHIRTQIDAHVEMSQRPDREEAAEILLRGLDRIDRRCVAAMHRRVNVDAQIGLNVAAQRLDNELLEVLVHLLLVGCDENVAIVREMHCRRDHGHRIAQKCEHVLQAMGLGRVGVDVLEKQRDQLARKVQEGRVARAADEALHVADELELPEQAADLVDLFVLEDAARVCNVECERDEQQALLGCASAEQVGKQGDCSHGVELCVVELFGLLEPCLHGEEDFLDCEIDLLDHVHQTLSDLCGLALVCAFDGLEELCELAEAADESLFHGLVENDVQVEGCLEHIADLIGEGDAVDCKGDAGVEDVLDFGDRGQVGLHADHPCADLELQIANVALQVLVCDF